MLRRCLAADAATFCFSPLCMFFVNEQILYCSSNPIGLTLLALPKRGNVVSLLVNVSSARDRNASVHPFFRWHTHAQCQNGIIWSAMFSVVYSSIIPFIRSCKVVVRCIKHATALPPPPFGFIIRDSHHPNGHGSPIVAMTPRPWSGCEGNNTSSAVHVAAWACYSWRVFNTEKNCTLKKLRTGLSSA